MIGVSLFSGKTVELTAINIEKDAATLAKWTLRPAVFQRMVSGNYHAVTEAEMKKHLTEILKKAEEKRNSFYFTVRLREDQKLIGYAQIPWFFQAHQAGQVYVDFGEESDLITYGDETLQLIVHYGFMEVNLYRLAAAIPAYETEMVELFERNGFLREVQRRDAVFHNGQYFDELEYAQLINEYKTLQEVRS
ncbi:MAG: GNAT family N-acetyltransferase [Anaerolineaceae bacterium]